MWRDLASKYYGIFKVAAVNCLEEEELCHDEFQAYDTPQAVVVPSNIRAEPVKYKGEWNVQAIAVFAVQYMESFVILVQGTNYQNFIE